MDTLLKFAIFFSLLSCNAMKVLNTSTSIKYQEWKPYALKKMKEEMVLVCSNWPAEWGPCPDGVADAICIASIEIDSNIIIIKELINSCQHDCQIAVIQQFLEGFNSWHCETFLVSKDTVWQGKEICKTSISGDPEIIKTEKPIERPVILNSEGINDYWLLKSGTFSSNGIIAITIMDKNLNILKCNLVLYP